MNDDRAQCSVFSFRLRRRRLRTPAGAAVLLLGGLAGCAALKSDAVGESITPLAIASRIDSLGQRVDAVHSRVEQSIQQNDTVSIRIMATALGATALLGYLPGKLAWRAVERIRKGPNNGSHDSRGS